MIDVFNIDSFAPENIMVGLMIFSMTILVFIGLPMKKSKKKKIIDNPFIFMVIMVSVIITTLTWFFGGFVLVTYLFMDRSVNGLREQVAVVYFIFSIGIGILYNAFKK